MQQRFSLLAFLTPLKTRVKGEGRVNLDDGSMVALLCFILAHCMEPQRLQCLSKMKHNGTNMYDCMTKLSQ